MKKYIAFLLSTLIFISPLTVYADDVSTDTDPETTHVDDGSGITGDGTGTPYVDKILFETQDNTASAEIKMWTHVTQFSEEGMYTYAIYLLDKSGNKLNGEYGARQTIYTDVVPDEQILTFNFRNANPGENILVIVPVKSPENGLATTVYAFDSNASRTMNMNCGGSNQSKGDIIMTEKYRVKDASGDQYYREYTEETEIENPTSPGTIKAGTGFEYPIDITYTYEVVSDGPRYNTLNDNGYLGTSYTSIEMLLDNIPETLQSTYEQYSDKYHIPYEETNRTELKILEQTEELPQMLLETDASGYLPGYYPSEGMPDGYVKDPSTCKTQYKYKRDNAGGDLWLPSDVNTIPWSTTKPGTDQRAAKQRTLYQAYAYVTKCWYKRKVTEYTVKCGYEAPIYKSCTKSSVNILKYIDCIEERPFSHDFCLESAITYWTDDECEIVGYNCYDKYLKPNEIDTSYEESGVRTSDYCYNGCGCDTTGASGNTTGKYTTYGGAPATAYSYPNRTCDYAGASQEKSIELDTIDLSDYSKGDSVGMIYGDWEASKVINKFFPGDLLEWDFYGEEIIPEWYNSRSEALENPYNMNELDFGGFTDLYTRTKTLYKIQSLVNVATNTEYYVHPGKTSTNSDVASWIFPEDETYLPEIPEGYESVMGKWYQYDEREVCKYKWDPGVKRTISKVEQTVTYELPQVYAEKSTGDLSSTGTGSEYPPKEAVGRKAFTEYCETEGTYPITVEGKTVGVNEYNFNINCSFGITQTNSLCSPDNGFGVNQYFRPIDYDNMFPYRDSGDNWSSNNDIIVSGETKTGVKPDDLINTILIEQNYSKETLYNINLSRTNILRVRNYSNEMQSLGGYLNYYKDESGKWRFKTELGDIFE